MAPRRILNPRYLFLSLTVSLLTFGFLLLLSASGVLRHLEFWTNNVFQTDLAEPLSPDILLVNIDKTSLNQAKKDLGLSWPWPRKSYIPVLNFLKKAGAKAVVFNILFTSPSPYGPRDDKAFAQSIKHFRYTFAAFQSIETSLNSSKNSSLPQRYSLPLFEDAKIPVAPGWVTPPPSLGNAFTGLGNITLIHPLDETNPQVYLWVDHQQKIYPQLALSAYWNLLGCPPLQLSKNGFQIGKQYFPLDQDGQMNLLLKTIPPEQMVPIIDLMVSGQNLKQIQNPLEDPAQFKNKIVVIGENISDFNTSENNLSLPAFTCAITLDNLLTGHCLRVVHISGLRWKWILLFCLIVGLLTLTVPRIFAFILFCFLTPCWLFLAISLYAGHQILIPLFLPWAALWISIFLGVLARWIADFYYIEPQTP